MRAARDPKQIQAIPTQANEKENFRDASTPGASVSKESVTRLNGAIPRGFGRVPTHAVGTANERRSYPRAVLRLPMKLKRVAGQAETRAITLLTKNISSSGVFFLCPQGIAPGTAIELEVALVDRPLGKGSVRMTTAAHVVRAEAAETPGWHGLAVTFDDISFHRDEPIPPRFQESCLPFRDRTSRPSIPLPRGLKRATGIFFSATLSAANMKAPRVKFAPQGVLFDWDGTLLDSYHADAQAYLAMFRALGIAWDVRDLEKHYSPDWYRVYRAARLPRSKWGEADRLWGFHYGKLKPELLPGARQVLRVLGRRFKLGLVTSGNRARVARQLRRFGLAKLFAARVCSEDAPRRKPHPAPLELALRRMRLEPEACVYVGDAPEDIEMARRAGVRAIAVLGPFPTHARLRASRPDALLDSIEGLPPLLARYGRRDSRCGG